MKIKDPKTNNSFYHVVVYSVSENDWKLWLKDLSEDVLQKTFVDPYDKGLNIYFEGTTYLISDIQTIVICKTNLNLANEIEAINKKSEKEYFHDKKNEQYDSSVIFIRLPPEYCKEYEIKDYCENVTNQYIYSYAGKGVEKSDTEKLFEHPFFVQHFKFIILSLVSIILILVGYFSEFYTFLSDWFSKYY